jgi:hypothetical protein
MGANLRLGAPHRSRDGVGIVVGVLQDFADAEISDLDHPIFAEEDVLTFQVPVLQTETGSNVSSTTDI